MRHRLRILRYFYRFVREGSSNRSKITEDSILRENSKIAFFRKIIILVKVLGRGSLL